MTPVRIWSPSLTFRSMTMRAPVAEMDSRCTDSQITSMGLPHTALRRILSSVECAQGAMPAILVRPTRSRALRSSGWNTTMTAMMPISKTRF